MNRNLMITPKAPTKKRFGGVIAAVTTGALALLTVAAPAQAHPMLPLAPAACSQYVFNGEFSLTQSNGNSVRFNSTGPVASGDAYDTGGPYGSRFGGVTGGITGDKIAFDIRWGVQGINGAEGLYSGAVGNDGFAHGETYDVLDTSSRAHWDSTVPLVCSTPAAAQAPPPPNPAPPTTVVQKAPDVQLPNISLAPPSAAPAPPKTLQGPTVSAAPGLTGVTFHVTDRSGVTSQCTYASEGFTSNSFSLPANGSFDLFVAAVRQFRTRTGTITCDNGTTAPTSVFF